jgi:geranylgeranyl reductase family protein
MGAREDRSRWDALIVGAGPAGSAVATLLARTGAAVLLLDRARFPRDKPCSEYLSPAATGVLDRLGGGILPRVEGTAHARLVGMRVVAPSGATMVGRFAAAHVHAPPRPYSFALPRTAFDAILRQAAEEAGAAVHEGVAVEDLLVEEGRMAGVVARGPDGRHGSIRARVVVGADGLRSVVARRLSVRRVSFPRRVAFTAHVAQAAGVEDLGEMHVGHAGYVGLGPIGDGLTTVALVLPRAELQRRPRDPRHDFFAELDRFPGLRGRFDHARMVRRVLTTGPFAQWSQRVTMDGACLVGDAADFFDPFTGQGIYNALRGAELAAAAIAGALATHDAVPARALAPYARARRAEFAGKWVLERLIGLGVGWPALAERVVTRLAHRPALADLLVGATGNFVPARAVLHPAALVRMVL